MCIVCCFSFVAFNNCSLCLIFVRLIHMCLGVFHLGFILFGTFGLLDLGGYFLPHFREVFDYYLLQYFLMAFLFVFFFWDTYVSNVGALKIVPEVFEIVVFLFTFFFYFLLFFLLCFLYFHHSIFHLIILSFASVILLLAPSRAFLISVISLFIND